MNTTNISLLPLDLKSNDADGREKIGVTYRNRTAADRKYIAWLAERDAAKISDDILHRDGPR